MKQLITLFCSANVASALEEASCKISEEEEVDLVVLPAQHGPPEILSKVEEQSAKQDGLRLQSQEAKEPAAVHKSSKDYIPQITSHTYSTGKQEVKNVISSYTLDTKEQQKIAIQDVKGEQATLSAQLGENLKQSMLKTSQDEVPRHAAKDLNNAEAQKYSAVKPTTNFIPEKLKTDISNQSVGRDSPKGLEVDRKSPVEIGLTTVPGNYSQSRSSGKIISSAPVTEMSSTLPSSGFQGKQSDNHDTLSTYAHVRGGPAKSFLFPKDLTGSPTRANALWHGVSTAGNIESLPVVPDLQIPLQEKFAAGKFVKRTTDSNVSELNSGPNLSKQFQNVMLLSLIL